MASPPTYRHDNRAATARASRPRRFIVEQLSRRLFAHSHRKQTIGGGWETTENRGASFRWNTHREDTREDARAVAARATRPSPRISPPEPSLRRCHSREVPYYAGMRKVNVVTPDSLDAERSPPCARAISRAIASPRPAPPACVLRDVSSR